MSGGALEDEAFEEALVRLERVSQRLVVEQQYGQRLEALTASLVGKIQSWVLRLRKEEAARNEASIPHRCPHCRHLLLLTHIPGLPRSLSRALHRF